MSLGHPALFAAVYSNFAEMFWITETNHDGKASHYLAVHRQRFLLEVSQRNMNATDYGYRVRKVDGTDSCRHIYRVVLAANTYMKG